MIQECCPCKEVPRSVQLSNMLIESGSSSAGGCSPLCTFTMGGAQEEDSVGEFFGIHSFT